MKPVKPLARLCGSLALLAPILLFCAPASADFDPPDETREWDRAGAQSGYCVQVPDRQEVRDLVEEFTGPQRAVFEAALRRSGRYLPMIRDYLAREGLPEELAYLALVESHFLPAARSSSRAIGLWQFIESTARNYGLRVDSWVDERLDAEGATRAAVRHLGDLYARFGDWNLAIAAYNAGPGAVGRALEAYGTESFWDLHAKEGLRHETCRYVVKFLAAVAIAADPWAYGLDPGPAEEPLAYDTIWADSPVDLPTVARVIDSPVAVLRALNPALLQDRTPPDAKQYPLHVPPGLGPLAAQEIAQLPPEERLSVVRHKVRRGETLSVVARRYGIGARQLADVNSLGRRAVLKAGQELLIPRGPARLQTSRVGTAHRNQATMVGDAHPTARLHEVRHGETAWSISRRYGITPAELFRMNGRSSDAVLRTGERLVIKN